MTELGRLIDPRMVVAEWAIGKRVKATDFDTMFLDHRANVTAYNYAHGKNLKPQQRNVLESAFNEYLRNIPTLVRAEISKEFKCTVENLEPLRLWVEGVTGKCEEDDLYVMAHWCWLVKRNSTNSPIVHHIMPLIISHKQGGGKSTAVNKLIKPYEQLTLELKVPQIVDERFFTMFSNYLIGFLDELSGADKVEINEFKRNLTSSTLTYRPMRTNSQEKITNLCSFIGSSNNALYDIIKDTTGTRRFFSIKALELLNHKLINSIDYDLLWKGINENLERGYYERVHNRVAEKQEEASMKDAVSLFLEDYSIIPNSDSAYVNINGKLLYEQYIKHTKDEGIKFPVAAQTFYKKLRDMGLQAVKKRDDKKVMSWFFTISSNNALSGGKYDS